MKPFAPLTRLGLPYMITGGAAAIVSGDPRLTNDLDVVLVMQPADAQRIAVAFEGPRIAHHRRRGQGRQGWL